VWAVLVALSIGALCFVYRFNTLGGPLAGFDNDHFFQIVRADAMLDGELPLRDYSDAELRSLWPPLTYATSAVAMKAMGRSLRSEALLTVGMLAVGAAALCWTAAVVAQGILPAALTTLLAVGLGPTLYNYPKIVPYVFAVMAMLAYARRPGAWRMLALALTVVVATLYRHDHGVYLSISSLVLILLVHGRSAGRPLAGYATFVLVGLLPGLVFVQQHGGILTYVRECLATSRSEIARTTDAPALLQIDWSQPWLARLPPPAAPRPRIAVLWTSEVTPEGRADAEQELGLAGPEQRGDDRNWSYALAETSSSRLAGIVQDPRVADTDGIDRQTFSLRSAPPAPVSRGGLFGWRVAPGILREANAAPWLLLVGWAVVAMSIGCLAWPPLRRTVERPDVPSAVVAAVGALGVLLFIVFLRNPAPHRLPDVSVPMVVLGAWLLAALPRVARTHSLPVRAALALLLTATTGLTIVSVGVIGTVPQQVVGTGVTEGAAGIADQWRRVWTTLGDLPESTSGINDALGSAATYLRRCTRPSDRLLVGDNLPELNYFARRGVAAGQSVFFGGFYTSENAQRDTVERWARQSVPLVLMQPPDRFSEEFGSDYPMLASYLRAHYTRAGTLDVRDGTPLDVWIDSTRSPQTDAETGLPCFVS
jgi:hypothetical protein